MKFSPDSYHQQKSALEQQKQQALIEQNTTEVENLEQQLLQLEEQKKQFEQLSSTEIPQHQQDQITELGGDLAVTNKVNQKINTVTQETLEKVAEVTKPLSALEKVRLLKEQKAQEKIEAEQKAQQQELQSAEKAQETYIQLQQQLADLEDQKKELQEKIDAQKQIRKEKIDSQRSAIHELLGDEETKDLLKDADTKQEIFGDDQAALDEAKKTQRILEGSLNEIQGKLDETTQLKETAYQQTAEGKEKAEEERVAREREQAEQERIARETLEKEQDKVVLLKIMGEIDEKIKEERIKKQQENQQKQEQERIAQEKNKQELAEAAQKEQERKQVTEKINLMLGDFKRRNADFKNELYLQTRDVHQIKSTEKEFGQETVAKVVGEMITEIVNQDQFGQNIKSLKEKVDWYDKQKESFDKFSKEYSGVLKEFDDEYFKIKQYARQRNTILKKFYKELDDYKKNPYQTEEFYFQNGFKKLLVHAGYPPEQKRTYGFKKLIDPNDRSFRDPQSDEYGKLDMGILQKITESLKEFNTHLKGFFDFVGTKEFNSQQEYLDLYNNVIYENFVKPKPKIEVVEDIYTYHNKDKMPKKPYESINYDNRAYTRQQIGELLKKGEQKLANRESMLKQIALQDLNLIKLDGELKERFGKGLQDTQYTQQNYEQFKTKMQDLQNLGRDFQNVPASVRNLEIVQGGGRILLKNEYEKKMQLEDQMKTLDQEKNTLKSEIQKIQIEKQKALLGFGNADRDKKILEIENRIRQIENEYRNIQNQAQSIIYDPVRKITNISLNNMDRFGLRLFPYTDEYKTIGENIERIQKEIIEKQKEQYNMDWLSASQNAQNNLKTIQSNISNYNSVKSQLVNLYS